MYEHQVSKEQFAYFPMLAHQNAVHNPQAMFRKPITIEQYLKAKMIAEPINLLDSSPIADGAAAVILVPWDDVEKNSQAIEVLACEVGTDTIALHDRQEMLQMKGIEISAQRAFATAGITPQDISFLNRTMLLAL